MRIPSGVTDQYIYFVAVDATDLKTREVGLTTFTVYRSRNGGTAAAMTTPTINETDTTNMPGVYELLLDEDMTIDAGDDSQEMVFHITHAGMAPVTRTIELYRPKITEGNTLDVTSTGAAGIDWGNVENVTTANNLTNTTIATVTTVTTVTNDVGVNEWNGVSLGTTNPLPNAAAGAAGGLPTDSVGKTGFNDISATTVNTEVANAIVTYRLDHLMHTAVTGTDITDNTVIAKMVSKSVTADWDTYDNTTDSAEAIRDRGDVAWITGGGGGITQILNVQPVIPNDIDLANTATVRFGLILTNAVDDLPTTAEITPGTISIERKAYGGTSWTAVVTDAAMSEQDGMVYYDEVVDSGTGYDYNDSIRVTFKSVSITADANTFDVVGASGIMFQTSIRQKYPSNFMDMLVSIGTGYVTVGTNNDKTGYEIFGTKTTLDDLNDIAATEIVSGGAITTLAGAVVNVDTVDTCTTNTDMVTVAAIADAVWDELLSGHLGVGSTGEALNAAGAAGDPWTTSLPGAYGAGSAGYIIGNNIDAAISTRASQSTADLIVADTNELQTDLADGGRLDLLIDAILADTTVIGADGSGLTALATQSSVNTIATYIDTEVAAIKAKTDQLTFTDAGKVDATMQAAADIKAAVANKIADHLLRRSLASALASSDGDTKSFRSLAGAVSKQVNKVSLIGSTLAICETDDTTVLGTQTATTTASADPVTALDTD